MTNWMLYRVNVINTKVRSQFFKNKNKLYCYYYIDVLFGLFVCFVVCKQF
eukprot:UN02417